jgi:hypothetical protein
MRKIASLVAALATGTALIAGAAPAAAQTHHDHSLAALRAATNRFHNIATAEQHKFGLLTDAQGIACIDMPGMGGMGVHYVKTSRVGKPAEHLTKPEALVYAPQKDGTLKLAAVEYVVLKSAWRANHTGRPSKFGHRFNFTPAGNRFGLPDYYSLHVWVWKHNPAGRFQMWNPSVHCP